MKKFIAIALMIYLPLQSMAWGMLGHRVVGEVADSYLTSTAKKKIKAILGNESVAMSSNWADFIKSDSNYRYLSPWHYVNFDSNLTYQQVRAVLAPDTGVNAASKLNFMVRELKTNKKLSLEKKQMYLRLIIHIVGDLHQPLHVSPKGTTGGNEIKVSWFSEPTNLHRVWDEHLIEMQGLSYTEMTKAINFTPLKQRQQLQKDPLANVIF